MISSDELDLMRQAAESAMPDQVEITRQSDVTLVDPTTGLPSAGLLDPDTGVFMPRVPMDVYSGQGRVRPRGTAEQEMDTGSLPATYGSYVASVPWSVPARVDDYLTVTGGSDPNMVGQSFRVVHVGLSSWQIDLRLGLEVSERAEAEAGS